MKKVIILLIIVLLGVGAYFGYYGIERIRINMLLNMGKPESCAAKSEDPAINECLRKACEAIDEENKQLEQWAADSKTYKEFKNKVLAWAEIPPSETKAGKILEQCPALRKQHNQEKNK